MKKNLIHNISKCKIGSVVAFKSEFTNEWYTGSIQSIEVPNSKYNKKDTWSVSISICLPIAPQWYDDDDKTVYYYDDILDMKLLEGGLI